MEFYGLLGEQLSHSLSPKIHELILKKINKSGAYKLFEVEKNHLKDFTSAIKVLKIKGSNVTIPYKEEVMKYLDNISEEAKRIGAINTIALVDDKLYGYNTDYYGFGYMLQYSNVSVENKVVVILGNGGASKAVLHYLLDNGAKAVYIASRTPEVNNNFETQKIKLISYRDLRDIKGDLLINSTPVGMYPKVGVSPVNSEVINNFKIIIDLIYNPKETELLSIGRNLGKKNIGGLFMLIGQAAKAQEIWQNKNIDKKIIEDIYNEINILFS